MQKSQKTMVMITLISLAWMGLTAQAAVSVMYGSGVLAGGTNGILVPAYADADVYYESGATMLSQPMQEYAPYSSWRTTVIPATTHPYIGFRLWADSPVIDPVYHDEASDPPMARYTPLETDAAGDHSFASAWLDIRSTGVTFSQDKLYFSLKCDTSTYPISSGASTFYSYMVALVDPNALPEDDPIVYGLMYTLDLGTVISPGLYKITGTGFSDLTRIGDITHSIDADTGTLLLSCNMADLLADTDFSGWFTPIYPRLTTTAITTKITLTGGTQQADGTDGAKLLLLPQLLPTQNNSDPVLSAPTAETFDNGGTFVLQAGIIYTDADANYPVEAGISVDGGDYQPLIFSPGQTVDYANPVAFTSSLLPVPGTWQEATFRFTNGDGYVYHTIQHGVPVADDNAGAPALQLSLYPNPVLDQLQVDVKTDSTRWDRMDIYNLRGQKVLSQELTAKSTTIPLHDMPGGVYLLRVSGPDGEVSRRFVKLD